MTLEEFAGNLIQEYMDTSVKVRKDLLKIGLNESTLSDIMTTDKAKELAILQVHIELEGCNDPEDTENLNLLIKEIENYDD